VKAESDFRLEGRFISEFELGIIRARMLDAARAKARRGELRIGVLIAELRGIFDGGRKRCPLRRTIGAAVVTCSLTSPHSIEERHGFPDGLVVGIDLARFQRADDGATRSSHTT
jgi:hypothetical protein